MQSRRSSRIRHHFSRACRRRTIAWPSISASRRSDSRVLRINIGGLGFLTAAPADQMDEALDLIFRNEYEIDARDLVRAEGTASGHRKPAVDAGQPRDLAAGGHHFRRGDLSRFADQMGEIGSVIASIKDGK